MRTCSVCKEQGDHDRRNCPNRAAVARALMPIARDFPGQFSAPHAEIEISLSEMTPDHVRDHHALSEAIHETEIRLRDASYDLIRNVGLALRASRFASPSNAKDDSHE